MTAPLALSDAAQRSIAAWHRFVASSDPAVLSPMLAPDVVFRSPFVHAPIPGHAATLLVLQTVATIFENFRYHREFVAGPDDAGLEFSARIGPWELKGIDLIRFNAAGQMIEFEVMIRPFKALQALSEAMGARIGPQLAQLKQAPAAAP
jgi:hypothetical protein